MDLPKLPDGYLWDLRQIERGGVAVYHKESRAEDPHHAYYDPAQRHIRHRKVNGWYKHTTDVSMEEAIVIMEQLVLLGEL